MKIEYVTQSSWLAWSTALQMVVVVLLLLLVAYPSVILPRRKGGRVCLRDLKRVG